MRLEDLQVELRPRSPWEAVELGVALVRRHARAVWLPWLLVTWPVFALLNAIAWWLDLVPWAGVAMWWLKPVFERIPLFVLSRAVFGAAPTVRETLIAQPGWGWRPMAGYLTWRRLGMARALYLPVDLLEGGARAGERRRVIGGSVRSVGVLLTVACLHFELALAAGALLLVLVFVPFEFLSDSAAALWAFLRQPSPAVQLLWNALAWLAASAIEPFYVAGGLGLYLNRRTQLEAWDVEIAFRRMRRRLEAIATPTLLACVLAFGWVGHANATPPTAPAKPCDCDASKAPVGMPLTRIFGDQYVDDARFPNAVARALRDPLLTPRKRESSWQRRHPEAPRETASSPFLLAIGSMFGVVSEWGLWIALGVLALVLAWTAPRWWPWLRDTVVPAGPRTPAVVTHLTLVEEDLLPVDVAGEARRRWRDGQPRQALALVYRASVESMAARTGATLVPGATEAECLRAARALPDDAREAFARAVRTWQYAAYAERLPAQEDFDGLLVQLAQRFGWPA
jgi:hypothetical protein